MDGQRTALVVVTKPASASALIAGARSLAQQVGVVFAGSPSQAEGADEGFRVPVDDAVPFIAATSAIVRLVLERRPDVVLVESSADGRLVAAALGGACRAGVVADATGISVREDGRLAATRMIYGGAAIQTMALSGMAIITASAGLFEGQPADPCPAIKDLDVHLPDGVRFLGRQAKPPAGADLSGEKVVVGVGRGVGSVSGLATVRSFAAAIGAGVGATRPVTEEEDWYDATGYLGISGDTIRPDVYVACGVSGQVQHMVGVNEAGLIFAINNDERATIFAECDYGIVGDVNQVVPQLIERFERTPG